jgi:hypothetical protein
MPFGCGFSGKGGNQSLLISMTAQTGAQHSLDRSMSAIKYSPFPLRLIREKQSGSPNDIARPSPGLFTKSAARRAPVGPTRGQLARTAISRTTAQDRMVSYST